MHNARNPEKRGMGKIEEDRSTGLVVVFFWIGRLNKIRPVAAARLTETATAMYTKELVDTSAGGSM